MTKVIIMGFLIAILSSSSLLINQFSGTVFAADMSLDTETNFDTKITLFKFDFSMSYNETQFEFKPVIDSEKHESDFETAIIGKKIGPAFVEAGIKDWVWGQELLLAPTYPLQKDTSYKGLEGTFAWAGHNLAIGAAQDRKDSDTLAGWLRMGFLFDRNDYTLVMSYKTDSFKDYTNLGGEFSYDFLNGITIYGGLNDCFEGTHQYAIGIQYLGKSDLMYAFEHYHNSDSFIGLNINNYASIYQNWQGEIRLFYDLTDSGTIQVLKIKYNKSNKIIPSLEIYNYDGPNMSPMIYFLNTYNYNWDSTSQRILPSEKGVVLKVTIKLD
jgi:hypothetical protein